MIRISLDTEAEPDEALLLEIATEGMELAASIQYFALGSPLNEVPRDDLRRRIASLLVQWLRRLERLKANEVCYLPFDFDPEHRHVGCFQVKAVENGQLLVLYGYTVAFAGKALPPETALQFTLHEMDFVVDTSYEIFFAPQVEFLSGLHHSIATLLTQP